jgi:PIN domain nuclease of toxin-antitoxin system
VSFLLLDTRLLLWSALDDDRLSGTARALIDDVTNALAFSAASIWEVSIKAGGRRGEGLADPRRLRRMLLDNGYRELPITAEHGIATTRLPPIHRDPFDRILVAQAEVEGAILLTADRTVARYPGAVRLVA